MPEPKKPLSPGRPKGSKNKKVKLPTLTLCIDGHCMPAADAVKFLSDWVKAAQSATSVNITSDGSNTT